MAVSFLFITLTNVTIKHKDMEKEELVIKEKFSVWNVFYDGGMIKTLKTDIKMTPTEALKHFKKAICVIGVNF